MMLVDENDDGIFDKATIYAEGLARISYKIRRERTEIECWCGFRADERVKLGRHLQSRPASVRSTGRGIQRSPHQCRDSGAQ